MTSTNQDFTMFSGDHKNLTVTVTDSAGASVSLTNASVSWMLAELPTGASLVLRTSDSGSGVTVSGCTFTVSLSPIHTASLGGIYYHEAQVRDSASQISTVTTGNVTIYKDVIII